MLSLLIILFLIGYHRAYHKYLRIENSNIKNRIFIYSAIVNCLEKNKNFCNIWNRYRFNMIRLMLCNIFRLTNAWNIFIAPRNSKAAENDNMS